MSSAHNEQFAYVTTIGRTSGLAREIEIWFVEDENVYILAEHGYRANWVRNIMNNSAVRVRIGDEAFKATARILDAKTDVEAYTKARELSRQKYGWGDGLPVELQRVAL